MFSSKSFVVWSLIFRSLIYFEFIFVYGVRRYSKLILLQVAVQFPSTIYWRDCLFSSIVCSWLLGHWSIDCGCTGLLLGFLSCSTDLQLCTCSSTLLFDYCGFIVQSGVGEPDFQLHFSFWGFLLLFRIFGVSTQVLRFFFGSISSKNAVSYLIGIALNLISLGSIVILMILILPIQEHGMSFHVFLSSSISFISVM